MGDLIAEAVEAVRARPRTALTALGIALGIAALVATIGLTGTAAAQLSARFDALKATTVTLHGLSEDETGEVGRVERLNGVVAAGVVSAASGELPTVRASGGPPVETVVMSASASALRALNVRPVSGRAYQDDTDRGRQVALLGDIAARSLGIDHPNTEISISGVTYRLIGIVTTPELDSQAPLAAIIPDWASAKRIDFGEPQLVIKTRLGAAQQVGREAKVALRPQAPDTLPAEIPPDPRHLRAQVETDARDLFLLMAAVSLLVGALSVANTMLIAVLERRHEIGLRRAVGATRGAILTQFLIESGLLGLAGGIVGGIAGLDVVIAVALAKGWTAAISGWVLAAAPLTGLLVGLSAGLHPAVRAGRMEPLTALAT
ncbi:ABC transporter permease [Acrocarpospora phusangensis]|uniref:ABC transporter permease n=1 Tax=Acrocarpospora phusangensis TaxID=1070424 RepID=A0A919ULY7_9ACTN|nr:ABC transporter permease [Acrocarpospora phusangensis]GIH22727.1 ABC transporter permease [Acrocarpospora phusangensis]